MDVLPHNIIGDLHGFTVWKSLVQDKCMNVFVGDFFDPYSSLISFEDCKANFMNLINHKKGHPESIIILYGNHEQHYLLQDELNERYSRFDYRHASEIKQLLKENAQYFDGVAYSINNKYLVTHAGVSIFWYQHWLDKYDGQSPDIIAKQINTLWDWNYRAFSVHENMKGGFAEDGPSHSPLWTRPWTLVKYNLFEGTSFKQIFGHTPCDKIEDKKGLICVDCLRSVRQYTPGLASLYIS